VSEVTDENTKNKFAQKFLDTGVVFQPEVPSKSDGRYTELFRFTKTCRSSVQCSASQFGQICSAKWLLSLLHMLHS
jgi:hypothetical protein